MKKRGLNFYQPIEGAGEFYWIAKISVAGKTAYYCVAETLRELLDKIVRIRQKHFPGLLQVKKASLEISYEKLVHTYVPGFIAERAYKKLSKKGVKEAKVPSNIWCPLMRNYRQSSSSMWTGLKALQLQKRSSR